MKNKEIRYLKAYKFSALFVAVGFGVFVLMSPERANLDSGMKHQAKLSAEKLAKEILQRKTTKLSEGSRIPASNQDIESEGQIGLDPWGQPYKYNILETDSGVARVVVQSQSDQGREIQGVAGTGPVDAQDLKPEY